jgi:hypothetical protein
VTTVLQRHPFRAQDFLEQRLEYVVLEHVVATVDDEGRNVDLTEALLDGPILQLCGIAYEADRMPSDKTDGEEI